MNKASSSRLPLFGLTGILLGVSKGPGEGVREPGVRVFGLVCGAA